MRRLKPIFLISLPRSGSTLLQKMLTVSPAIHSTPEPWIMLPLASMFSRDGTRTIYSHDTFSNAMNDFLNFLPHGINDVHAPLASFITALYSLTCPNKNACYFLDKTPRYYLIVKFLHQTFPHAKFIFLFRNPLAVLASIFNTWTKNKFFLYKNHIDIFKGPHALAKGYRLLGEGAAVSINYDDLVTAPENTLKHVCNYLEIDFDTLMICNYKKIKIAGKMGDHKGVELFDEISPTPLTKWKTVLSTRYRRRFARKYIKQLGDETLKEFSTDVDSLIHDIDSIQEVKSGSLQDLFYHFLSTFMILIDFDHFKKAIFTIRKKEKIFPYY